MASRLCLIQPLKLTRVISCCIIRNSFSALSTSGNHSSRDFSRCIQYGIRSNPSIVSSPKISEPLEEKEHSFLPHTESKAEVLDDHLIEHEANGLSMQGTLRILLLLHATQDDTESVLNLLNKAKINHVKPSVETMARILVAYIRNKNVDAAINMYTSIQVAHPSYTLDCNKVLDLCTLLVEKGRRQEAVKTLKEYIHLDVTRTIDFKQIKENCGNLLTAAATTCDYKLTKQLLDTLLSAGLVRPENYIVVPLLQCKLNSGDIPGAVEVAKVIYKTYKLLPKRMEMLLLLLHHYKELSMKITLPSSVKCGDEQSDTANGLLEQMFSLIVHQYGSLQAQHDLMFACLETGCPDVARNVLQMHRMMVKKDYHFGR
ncbi:leucine-rich PPR motif-containing protein, mitochondrial-like isoform X2 [Homarus americanus]|uniref:leucine-rich PPR motif-containing protein, mitochondrial-like isoform X2 n=1 Tax=Homarus americanus TaxID=6706 RepID=UPI001C43BFEE|nr:leucine-rich PPR motif-containing protein, mitochondrial-like isoform X2 [Homarus americanus]